MIITQSKTLEQILGYLKDFKKVLLVGCGECATTCKTGGKDELENFQKELEKNGKTVTAQVIPKAPCISSQIKMEIAKNMKAVRESEAIVVFSCGLGVQSVKDNDRLGLPVFPGCDTLCGAVMDAKGDFLEKCSMCGECVLGVTAGVCPVTLCPKGLLNGPCGGMNKGKCEVDKERDCAWVVIYKELEKQKRLDTFKDIQAPKDYKKTVKPRKLTLERQNG